MGGDLVGRGGELAAATTVLDGIDAGPIALVLEGEAGIGKTALWRAVVAAAADRGLTVLCTRPAEPETGLAFGSLADLLLDVDDGVLGALPSPQRRALEVALLRAEPGGVDSGPRAVPAATLSVLLTLAGRCPTLLALDDAQWLDSASAGALAYAVRRLGSAPVFLLVAVRRPGPDAPLGLDAALPQGRLRRLRLGPMSAGALQALFETRLGHAFPRPTLERIAEASAGNPFHALEIARALDDLDGLTPGAPLPVPTAIRDVVRGRVRNLPPAVREALLRVAALSRPPPAVVHARDLAPAEAAGVVEVHLDGRVAFAHPLFAAAVYGDASSAERRAVHRSLATVVGDLEERARHEALAATGPDPAVAELLTSAAARARARGAPAIAAELVQLALWLTPAGATGERFLREVRLAHYLWLAGQVSHAEHLLDSAIRAAPPGDARDEALITLALILRETDVGRAVEACEAAVAKAANPAIVARAHATLGLLLDTLDIPRAAGHAAAAAALFESLGDRSGWALAVLARCWHRLLQGDGADEAAFRRALEVQRRSAPLGRWRSGIPQQWALAHDDFALARARFARSLERARGEGHESDVALLQAVIAQIDCWRGDPAAADAGSAEAHELARLSGSPATLADVIRMRANVHALLGRLDPARELLGPGLTALERPDEGRFAYATSSILGFIAWSDGDAADADAHLGRAVAALEAAGIREIPGFRYLGDHVEAVLALGDTDRAESIVAGLEARAAVFSRPWSLAVAARCRALVLAARGDPDGALASITAAVGHHERLESPYELGRTLLAKAHVHRRRTEKRLARDSLELAAVQLELAGAALWAGRAREELGRFRFRAAPTELTETELRIAQLAAAGRTNREIASAVFVSPKTVETRLASVYGKLGIRSRAELGAWMAGRAGRGEAAPGDGQVPGESPVSS